MTRKKQYKGSDTIRETPGDLWIIITKLRGLAVLFRMSDGEVPVNEEEFHGISCLIGDIADQIEAIRDLIEYVTIPLI